MTEESGVRQTSAAEQAKFEAEAQKLRSEARVAEVQAQHEAVKLEDARIKLGRLLEEERERKASNKHHHVYAFTEPVTATTVKTCIAQLAIWMRTEPGCDVEIVFSSPGGSVIDGMALWDYIQQVRAAGHRVATGTIGYAASMAGILLQAGDVRWMGKEAYILVHEASFGAGGKIGEVEDELVFIRKIQSRILDIFASRTKLTKRQLEQRWRRKDWWLDSVEALKFGFVDEVR